MNLVKLEMVASRLVLGQEVGHLTSTPLSNVACSFPQLFLVGVLRGRNSSADCHTSGGKSKSQGRSCMCNAYNQ